MIFAPQARSARTAELQRFQAGRALPPSPVPVPSSLPFSSVSLSDYLPPNGLQASITYPFHLFDSQIPIWVPLSITVPPSDVAAIVSKLAPSSGLPFVFDDRPIQVQVSYNKEALKKLTKPKKKVIEPEVGKKRKSDDADAEFRVKPKKSKPESPSEKQKIEEIEEEEDEIEDIHQVKQKPSTAAPAAAISAAAAGYDSESSLPYSGSDSDSPAPKAKANLRPLKIREYHNARFIRAEDGHWYIPRHDLVAIFSKCHSAPGSNYSGSSIPWSAISSYTWNPKDGPFDVTNSWGSTNGRVHISLSDKSLLKPGDEKSLALKGGQGSYYSVAFSALGLKNWLKMKKSQIDNGTGKKAFM